MSLGFSPQLSRHVLWWFYCCTANQQNLTQEITFWISVGPRQGIFGEAAVHEQLTKAHFEEESHLQMSPECHVPSPKPVKIPNQPNKTLGMAFSAGASHSQRNPYLAVLEICPEHCHFIHLHWRLLETELFPFLSLESRTKTGVHLAINLLRGPLLAGSQQLTRNGMTSKRLSFLQTSPNPLRSHPKHNSCSSYPSEVRPWPCGRGKAKKSGLIS